MTRRQTVDEADLTRRIDAMSLKEKVTLLTGGDAWTLTPVVAAGLASLALSDGPVGPRGTTFGDNAAPALLFPSPSSLSAAWDEDTAYEAGRLMGLKAREMGIHVLLAPTVNLHRSPWADGTSSATPKTRTSPPAPRSASSRACSRPAWPPPSSTSWATTPRPSG